MMKLPCELIQDLLPSYIDNLTGEVTNRLVDEHLAGCGQCRHVLETMREPSAVSADAADKKEIDFLKKARRRMRGVIVCSVLAVIAVVVSVYIGRVFFVGNYIFSDSVACDVNVEKKHLTLSGVIADETLAISSVEYEQEGGIVTVSLKAVRKSPFHKGGFKSEYKADEEITQVRLDSRIIWDHGESVSAVASAVYNTWHAYVGDITANGKTAQALNMGNYLGDFTNELQTDTEPYGWKMIFEDEVNAAQQKATEKKMKNYAYILLAVIENLGEVSYEYKLDGKMNTITVTAEEASSFAGQEIKLCGQEVLSLQELIRKTGLDDYAYANAGRYMHDGEYIGLTILNNTDTDISGMGISYYVNEKLCGTQEGVFADGSLIKQGDHMYFSFASEDFDGKQWNSQADVTIEVSVYDKDKYCHIVEKKFRISAEQGVQYNYTLMGNASDGYIISQ